MYAQTLTLLRVNDRIKLQKSYKNERNNCDMLFGKKKKQNGMAVDVLLKFDKCPIKYVTERDSETLP